MVAKEKTKKVSFVMYFDFIETLNELDDKEFREITEKIFEYAETRKKPQFSSRVLEIIFIPIQKRLDDDYNSWLKSCQKKSLEKKKYWSNRKPKEESTIVYNSIQNDTTVYNSIDDTNEYTRDTDSDYDYDCDYDNNSVCNNIPACEEVFRCHLGALEKEESCHECMKKNICPFKESAKFLLKHKDGFKVWDENLDKLEKEFVEIHNKEPTDLSILEEDIYG